MLFKSLTVYDIINNSDLCTVSVLCIIIVLSLLWLHYILFKEILINFEIYQQEYLRTISDTDLYGDCRTRPFEVLRVNYILSSMHDVQVHNIIRCASSIQGNLQSHI